MATDELGAYFGNPNVARQGKKARDNAANRDVNTLPDPQTYAFMSGLLGTAPDEQGFSVVHPKAGDIQAAGENGLALGLLTQLAPITKGLPVGASIKPEVLQDVLDRLNAFKRGEKPAAVIKDGLLTTPEQRNALNAAYDKLTNGSQPPYERSAMDIQLGHIYDSRVSGKVKPSGLMADSFEPNKVADWMRVVGDDSAKVGVNRFGQPHLENLYVDPTSSESYLVRMPISASHASGVQWVSGLVPDGQFAKKKP